MLSTRAATVWSDPLDSFFALGLRETKRIKITLLPRRDLRVTLHAALDESRAFRAESTITVKDQ